MRTDLYNSLADALNQANTELLNLANLREKILPYFFVSSDHWIMQLY